MHHAAHYLHSPTARPVGTEGVKTLSFTRPGLGPFCSAEAEGCGFSVWLASACCVTVTLLGAWRSSYLRKPVRWLGTLDFVTLLI